MMLVPFQPQPLGGHNARWLFIPWFSLWPTPCIAQPLSPHLERSSCLHTIDLHTRSESESHSVVSDSLWTHGLYSSQNSPAQNTGHSVLLNAEYSHSGTGTHSLLQGIFPTQGSNLGLPHCRQGLYHLSHQEHHMELLLLDQHRRWRCKHSTRARSN